MSQSQILGHYLSAMSEEAAGQSRWAAAEIWGEWVLTKDLNGFAVPKLIQKVFLH